MRRTITGLLCFWLPKRFRRCCVLGPIYLVLCICLIVALVLLATSLINSDEFFQPGPLAKSADMQFAHLADVIRKADETGRLDIYSGYNASAGKHIEWDPIFYMFASMALGEIHRSHPERRDEVGALLGLCARGVVRVPHDVPNDQIPSFLAARDYSTMPTKAGYVGVVLGLRKTITHDSLFDAALVPIAESLAMHINTACGRCSSEWTSDHATQLYAIWLYDQAFGKDHSALFDHWLNVMKSRFLEDGTRLLHSHISVNPDENLCEPRATSVAWTAIFLADVMPDFAREQYGALCKHRQRRFFTLAATREYPHEDLLQLGDRDPGPLGFGVDLGATGFTLCTHKLFGSPAAFGRTYRVMELLGSPEKNGGKKCHRRGNAMVDAVMLYAEVAEPRSPH
jgi:hypothetical protein